MFCCQGKSDNWMVNSSQDKAEAARIARFSSLPLSSLLFLKFDNLPYIWQNFLFKNILFICFVIVIFIGEYSSWKWLLFLNKTFSIYFWHNFLFKSILFIFIVFILIGKNSNWQWLFILVITIIDNNFFILVKTILLLNWQ